MKLKPNTNRIVRVVLLGLISAVLLWFTQQRTPQGYLAAQQQALNSQTSTYASTSLSNSFASSQTPTSGPTGGSSTNPSTTVDLKALLEAGRALLTRINFEVAQKTRKGVEVSRNDLVLSKSQDNFTVGNLQTLKQRIQSGNLSPLYTVKLTAAPGDDAAAILLGESADIDLQGVGARDNFSSLKLNNTGQIEVNYLVGTTGNKQEIALPSEFTGLYAYLAGRNFSRYYPDAEVFTQDPNLGGAIPLFDKELTTLNNDDQSKYGTALDNDKLLETGVEVRLPFGNQLLKEAYRDSRTALPTFAGDQLFLRDSKSQVCIDLEIQVRDKNQIGQNLTINLPNVGIISQLLGFGQSLKLDTAAVPLYRRSTRYCSNDAFAALRLLSYREYFNYTILAKNLSGNKLFDSQFPADFLTNLRTTGLTGMRRAADGRTLTYSDYIKDVVLTPQNFFTCTQLGSTGPLIQALDSFYANSCTATNASSVQCKPYSEIRTLLTEQVDCVDRGATLGLPPVLRDWCVKGKLSNIECNEIFARYGTSLQQQCLLGQSGVQGGDEGGKPAGSEKFEAPVSALPTSSYGPGTDGISFRFGTTFGASVDAPVYPTAPGTVLAVVGTGNAVPLAPGVENAVIVKHGQLCSIYGNLSNTDASLVGKSVARTTSLGSVASTAGLYFEVRVDCNNLNSAIDAEPLLGKYIDLTTGKIAGGDNTATTSTNATVIKRDSDGQNAMYKVELSLPLKFNNYSRGAHTMEDFIKDTGSCVAINANFYDSNAKGPFAIGVYGGDSNYSNQDTALASMAIGTVRQAALLPNARIRKQIGQLYVLDVKNLSANELSAIKAAGFAGVTGIPVIFDGNVQDLSFTNAFYSALAISTDGKLSAYSAMRVNQEGLTNLLLKKDANGQNAAYAIVLDGGPSTQLYAAGGGIDATDAGPLSTANYLNIHANKRSVYYYIGSGDCAGSTPGVLGASTTRPANVKGATTTNVSSSDSSLLYYDYPVAKGTPQSSQFGPRPSLGDNHKGLDFSANAGTPVHPSAPGIVVYAEVGRGTVKGYDGQTVGAYPGFGNLVIVRHGLRSCTMYAHLSSISPDLRNKAVTPADIIGQVGSTGNSTGPHLHFEVRTNCSDDDYAVNPQLILERQLDLDKFNGNAGPTTPNPGGPTSPVTPNPDLTQCLAVDNGDFIQNPGNGGTLRDRVLNMCEFSFPGANANNASVLQAYLTKVVIAVGLANDKVELSLPSSTGLDEAAAQGLAQINPEAFGRYQERKARVATLFSEPNPRQIPPELVVAIWFAETGGSFKPKLSGGYYGINCGVYLANGAKNWQEEVQCIYGTLPNASFDRSQDPTKAIGQYLERYGPVADSNNTFADKVARFLTFVGMLQRKPHATSGFSCNLFPYDQNPTKFLAGIYSLRLASDSEIASLGLNSNPDNYAK